MSRFSISEQASPTTLELGVILSQTYRRIHRLNSFKLSQRHQALFVAAKLMFSPVSDNIRLVVRRHIAAEQSWQYGAACLPAEASSTSGLSTLRATYINDHCRRGSRPAATSTIARQQVVIITSQIYRQMNRMNMSITNYIF